MIKTPDEKYYLFFNSLGQCESANLVETGETVWVKDADNYQPETNPLTAEFFAGDYDLSDRPDLAIPEILP